MTKQYNNALKRLLCDEVCLHGKSTIKTAEKYDVPLKTFENWITAYRKNTHCFDEDDSNDLKLFQIKDISKEDLYDDLSNDELKFLLMKKDIEITRLKKGYMVKGGGMVPKEFVTFCKKNMK